MADIKNTPALQSSHTRTTKNRPFPTVPRDARDAAAQGYNVASGSPEFNFDFPDGSTMLLKGKMDVEGGEFCSGRLTIPFTAEYKFGKPIAAKN
jgi:hypothetical protein